MTVQKDIIYIYKLENKYEYSFDKAPTNAQLKLKYIGFDLKLLDSKFRDIFNDINECKIRSDMEIISRIASLLKKYNKVSSFEFDNI
jgi:hypothetical protein